MLVQRIAAAAEEDLKKHNVKFREYSILAALGTRRTNKQNCQRDLLRKIPVPLFPEPPHALELAKQLVKAINRRTGHPDDSDDD